MPLTPSEAKSAIDALRKGVTNRYIPRKIVPGREQELTRLLSTLRNQPNGSCQFVFGRDRHGKSDLCQAFGEEALDEGFAVAIVEVGAVDEHAQRPSALLDAIRKNIHVRHEGHDYQGGEEVCFLAYASRPPRIKHEFGFDERKEAFRKLPNANQLRRRYELLKNYWNTNRRTPVNFLNISKNTMTTANLAFRSIVNAAELLHTNGCAKGLVLLINEAERAGTSPTPYRGKRAMTTMLGLALGSANLNTAKLHHYFNKDTIKYNPNNLSRVHTTSFFDSFSPAIPILEEIYGSSLRTSSITLQPIGRDPLREIAYCVSELYSQAYDTTPHERRELYTLVDPLHANGKGLHEVIRILISHFDHCRNRAEPR